MVNTKKTADRIKDIGPEPQSFDIECATKENTNVLSVAWSGRYLQVTLMSIPAGSDIGLEAHPETDQFPDVLQGQYHCQRESTSASLADSARSRRPKGHLCFPLSRIQCRTIAARAQCL